METDSIAKGANATGLDLIRYWRSEALKQVRVQLPPHLGLSYERAEYFRSHRPPLIIGADEVGRGPLAGPVTVCAFMAGVDWHFPGLKDSKKHTVLERALISERLQTQGLGFHIAEADSQTVDRRGMVQTLQILFEECLEKLRERFPGAFDKALIVLDGKEQARHVDHISLPKADDIVQHVSAASVLAKVYRDKWMATTAHQMYPQYGFDTHVGYGTEKHKKAIAKYGTCPLHRESFLKNKNAWKE